MRWGVTPEDDTRCYLVPGVAAGVSRCQQVILKLQTNFQCKSVLQQNSTCVDVYRTKLPFLSSLEYFSILLELVFCMRANETFSGKQVVRVQLK